jgi:hypothetical protein
MRMICNFMKMAPVILESRRRRLTQLGKKIWRRVLSIDLLALISGQPLSRRFDFTCNGDRRSYAKQLRGGRPSA